MDTLSKKLFSCLPNLVIHAARQKVNQQQHLEALLAFVEQEKREADKSSREWADKGPPGNEQAAYRSGMWFAYQQVWERLEPICRRVPL